jgi:hypothetical protein
MASMFTFVFDDAPIMMGIERVGALVADMDWAWDAIIPELQAVMREEKAYEGDVGGIGQWADLSEPYATYKALQWGNVGILTASGAMFEALTGETSDTIVEKTPDSLVWGVGGQAGYAAYHQSGTDRMPQRRIFDAEILREAVAQGFVVISKGLVGAWSGQHWIADLSGQDFAGRA